jgi:hypothetical protein
VAVGLIVDDFYSFLEARRRFLTGARIKNGKFITSGNPDKPYFMPFQTCIKIVLSHGQVGGKVYFFFGLNTPFASYANQFFQDLLQYSHTEYRDRIGTVAYPAARETPQLQAADLLVHLYYKDVVRRNATNSWDSPHPPLLSALLGRYLSAKDVCHHTKKNIEDGLDLNNIVLPDTGR